MTIVLAAIFDPRKELDFFRSLVYFLLLYCTTKEVKGSRPERKANV
jgi:hypothetical protein